MTQQRHSETDAQRMRMCTKSPALERTETPLSIVTKNLKNSNVHQQ